MVLVTAFINVVVLCVAIMVWIGILLLYLGPESIPVTDKLVNVLNEEFDA